MEKKQNNKTLAKSEKGSVFIIVAFAIMALVGAIGSAIDFQRGQLVQARLSKAIDAAGLAAGATISTTDITSEALKYLNANFQNYMGAEIAEFNVSVSDDNSVISLSATASIPTTLMKVFGTSNLTVHAESEITRAITGLELVMVLDNTGSMDGYKLSSLKDAANNLVDILFGDDETAEDLWIGLVPFSQSVNIGPEHTDWLDSDHYDSLDWGPTSWAGCVEAREDGYDVTDDTYLVKPFKAYYWASHYWYNDWDHGDHYHISTWYGPNKYCSQEVTRLTSSKSTITDAINDMEAVGYTHINYGAVWGWRMLSPNWQGLWGGEMNANNLPLAYNTPKMNKAAIIMTDGSNTTSNYVDTAYGYLWEGLLGSTSYYETQAELDSRLLEVCTSMKDNNIIVYTISFGNISSSSKQMMEDCATQDNYYFDSPNSTELQQAFAAIGDSLSNLRVSK